MTIVHSLGHSTRPAAELVALLESHGIRTLVDVRTIPRSRHNPQYNGDAIAGTLRDHGIGYVHAPELGGLRKPRPDSTNVAWRNASFRGYADYMQTPPFDAALDALVARAQQAPTAIMCAEAVPWRCHRSLIADALIARGIDSVEITSVSRTTPHKLTAFARVDGDRVTYPAAGFVF